LDYIYDFSNFGMKHGVKEANFK